LEDELDYDTLYLFKEAKLIKIPTATETTVRKSKKEEVANREELIKVQNVIDKLPLPAIFYDAHYKIIYINQFAENTFGYKLSEVKGKSCFESIIPNRHEPYFNDLMKGLEDGNLASEGKAEFKTKEGNTVTCDWNCSPNYDSVGNFIGVTAMFHDVTLVLTKERILAQQKKVLELIVSGAPLISILNVLIKFIEEESGRALGSILILDHITNTLHTGAGPDLPDQYNQVVNGLKPGLGNGSCGTAVYLKEMVVTEDTYTDPNWSEYKEIAKHFGLKACTSIPLFSSNNEILGTFAFYYREQTLPSQYELKLIKASSFLAGLAIEKHNEDIASRDMKEMYKFISENINNLITIYDQTGKIIFTSPSVKNVLGFQPSEIIGMDVAEYTHPDDIFIMKKFIDKVLSSKNSNAVEIVRKVNVNGTYNWLQCWGKLIQREGRNFVMTVGHDITEQKRAEDALKQSEKQLVEAQKITNLGSFEWNLLNDELTCSDQLYKILGLTKTGEQLLFPDLIQTFYSEDKKWVKQAIDKAIKESGILDIEVRIQKQSNEIQHIQLKCNVVYNKEKKPLKVLGTCQDITTRKNVELALKISEEKFRTTFESANIGMALVDPDGNFIKCNSSWRKIIGYTEDEFRLLNIANIIDPSQINKHIHCMDQIINGEITYWNSEEIFLNKKGNKVWGLFNTSLLRDNENHPLYFICILQNITERKNAEENQKRLTEDLITQNKYLQQYSYIVSHNLQAPISNIIGLVDLFALNFGKEQEGVFLESLKKAAQNLDVVVKDLNSMISYKKGINENKQEIVFEEIMGIIKKNLEKQIIESKATIITNFEKVSSIKSVHSYVLSIITNLIDNAIKYKSLDRPPIIKLETHSELGFVCMRICDNGLGIDLNLQKDKLFGFYKRFHTHVPGKGMGMHLVKTQIESLGGRIEIASEVDKGTCIRIYFKKD
jgi:PAS domain S-box-containing protein